MEDVTMRDYFRIIFGGFKYLAGFMIVVACLTVGVLMEIIGLVVDLGLDIAMPWCGFEKNREGEWVRKKEEDIIDVDWWYKV